MSWPRTLPKRFSFLPIAIEKRITVFSQSRLTTLWSSLIRAASRRCNTTLSSKSAPLWKDGFRKPLHAKGEVISFSDRHCDDFHPALGRAGRVKPGHCFYLVTRPKLQSLSAYPTPEIQRTQLDDLCLEIVLLGLGEIEYIVPLLVPLLRFSGKCSPRRLTRRT